MSDTPIWHHTLAAALPKGWARTIQRDVAATEGRMYSPKYIRNIVLYGKGANRALEQAARNLLEQHVKHVLNELNKLAA